MIEIDSKYSQPKSIVHDIDNLFDRYKAKKQMNNYDMITPGGPDMITPGGPDMAYLTPMGSDMFTPGGPHDFTTTGIENKQQIVANALDNRISVTSVNSGGGKYKISNQKG